MSTSTEQVEKIRGWLTGRLPQDWFEGPPDAVVDREEITVVGRLPEPATAEGASDAERAAAVSGRIKENTALGGRSRGASRSAIAASCSRRCPSR